MFTLIRRDFKNQSKNKLSRAGGIIPLSTVEHCLKWSI